MAVSASAAMEAVYDERAWLILQVNEYPGKTDHYRKCLEIIADAPDAERPGIKQFLGTGTLGELLTSCGRRKTNQG